MDIRKKEIKDLEDKKRRTLVSLDKRLETLGKTLLGGLGDTLPKGSLEGTPPEPPEYREFLKEIDRIKGGIAAAEQDMIRLATVEEDIKLKEDERSEIGREQGAIRLVLGESLLSDPEFEDFAEPFRASLAAVEPKIESLETRLAALEEQGGGNVFIWIGKNAQIRVLQTLLAKNRSGLRQIYKNACEKYLQNPRESVPYGKVRDALLELDRVKAGEEEISGIISELQEVRNAILESFRPEGNGKRKIHALERQIARVEEQLAALYKSYGREAEDKVRAYPSVKSDIRLILEEIDRDRQEVREDEKRIATLQISLAIDEEREKIEKMEKTIRESREKIADAESLIEELLQGIEDAKNKILELSEKGHGGEE